MLHHWRTQQEWVQGERPGKDAQCGTNNSARFLLFLVPHCFSEEELALLYPKGFPGTLVEGGPAARVKAQHKRKGATV